MPAILLGAPESEPISLAAAKGYLRVEHDDEDELIAALLAAARGAVEAATRRVLVTQSWRIVLDRWPGTGRIASPVNPLRSLAAARVFAGDGTPGGLALDAFMLDAVSAPAIIAFDRGRVPAPGRALAGIELDVSAGYGEAEDIPPALVQAVRLLLARAYAQRDEVRADALPEAVAALVAPFRILSV